jgi:hypothetical protein
MSARLGAKKIITLRTGHASLASKPHEVSELIERGGKERRLKPGRGDTVWPIR